MKSSIPVVKATTRPRSAIRNLVALSFHVNGQITTKFSGLSVWITSVPLSGSILLNGLHRFVKRIANWSVQEARTEAVLRGDKSTLHIQFDGFYLTHGHYSNNSSANIPSTMRRLAKLLHTHTEQSVAKVSANWEGTSGGAAWPIMLRHQAAENSLITSGAAKKELFSTRDNCSRWILKQFERTSYFLGIQAWVLRQNEKQTKYAQKSGQRSTISILFFLIFVINQNACLNFLKTAFELLLYGKCGKKV